METRKIKKTFKSKPTIEGAGVHLKRAFGYNEIPMFDPFLMMDDFRINEPSKFIKGFPWHPHRGIETITYLLEGSVEHKDSLGNSGILSPGDVQWMTAGSGIIHQEMPKGNVDGKMYGFQLWANLPAKNKMMNPRYQDIKSTEIPEVLLDNGTKIKIICGTAYGTKGPVNDIVTDPDYLDITVPQNSTYSHPTKKGYCVFVYVIGGMAKFSNEANNMAENETLILFDDGEQIQVSTKVESVRFLFLTGKPLNEPIAWGGPIVMNTNQELQLAFTEYENGTFIKYK